MISVNTLMVTIEINGLRLYARHGVGEQERTVGNEFEVTLHLECRVDDAMSSDDVADTVNYAEVIDTVRAEMDVPSQLLEHVAARVRDAVCRRFPLVAGGMVKVAKLTPPIPCQLSSVAVTVRW